MKLARLLNSLPVTWAVLALPALPFLFELYANERYFPELMYETGLLSVQLLVLSLLITPLQIILGNRAVARAPLRFLLRRRRALGVAAFGFAVLHTIFYARYTGALDLVRLEAFEPRLLLGWLALFAMTLGAATSNRWSQQRLGWRWKWVQRSVYSVALLTALHWWWIGQFVDELWVYLVPLLALQAARLGVRWYRRKGFRSGSAAAV